MGQPTSLRERKRLTAMRRVQDTALQLFDELGYAQVPIERIAAEAEVSASSVYRYFGTKEQIVLWDENDEPALALFGQELQRGYPPLAALRRAVTHALDSMGEDDWRDRRRTHYMLTEPSLYRAALTYAHEMGDAITALVAEHTDRSHDDVDVQLCAHALVGAIIVALRRWYQAEYAMSLREIIDRMLDSLEHGFRL